MMFALRPWQGCFSLSISAVLPSWGLLHPAGLLPAEAPSFFPLGGYEVSIIWKTAGIAAKPKPPVKPVRPLRADLMSAMNNSQDWKAAFREPQSARPVRFRFEASSFVPPVQNVSLAHGPASSSAVLPRPEIADHDLIQHYEPASSDAVWINNSMSSVRGRR